MIDPKLIYIMMTQQRYVSSPTTKLINGTPRRIWIVEHADWPHTRYEELLSERRPPCTIQMPLGVPFGKCGGGACSVLLVVSS